MSYTNIPLCFVLPVDSLYHITSILSDREIHEVNEFFYSRYPGQTNKNDRYSEFSCFLAWNQLSLAYCAWVYC